jgi:hypothetical protein
MSMYMYVCVCVCVCMYLQNINLILHVSSIIHIQLASVHHLHRTPLLRLPVDRQEDRPKSTLAELCVCVCVCVMVRGRRKRG